MHRYGISPTLLPPCAAPGQKLCVPSVKVHWIPPPGGIMIHRDAGPVLWRLLAVITSSAE